MLAKALPDASTVLIALAAVQPRRRKAPPAVRQAGLSVFGGGGKPAPTPLLRLIRLKNSERYAKPGAAGQRREF